MIRLLIIISILFLFSCKEKFDNKTYEENKLSLAQRESKNPRQFLKLFSDNKKNIFGTTVIKGKIENTATIATYKNTRLKMLCYKNGIRVEEHEDVMAGIIKPGAAKNFKIKYHLSKGTDSLALCVMSAEAISDTVTNSKK